MDIHRSRAEDAMRMRMQLKDRVFRKAFDNYENPKWKRIGMCLAYSGSLHTVCKLLRNDNADRA